MSRYDKLHDAWDTRAKEYDFPSLEKLTEMIVLSSTVPTEEMVTRDVMKENGLGEYFLTLYNEQGNIVVSAHDPTNPHRYFIDKEKTETSTFHITLRHRVKKEALTLLHQPDHIAVKYFAGE